MDSVQRLRAQAQKAGNLKSNEQVKVSMEARAARRRRRRRSSSRRAAAAGDRDPAGAALGRLRAGVQPDGRLRAVGLSGVSAVLLSAAAGLLVLADDRHRHRVGRGHRRQQRAVGRLQLGLRHRRRHQRQPLQQHQRQPADRRQQQPDDVEPQSRASEDGVPGRRRDAQNLDNKYQAGNREQFRGKDASRDASRERASQTMQDRGVGRQGRARATIGAAKARDKSGARDKAQSADKSAARDKARARTVTPRASVRQAAQPGQRAEGRGQPRRRRRRPIAARRAKPRRSEARAVAVPPRRAAASGERAAKAPGAGGDRAAKAPSGGGRQARAAAGGGGGGRPGGGGDGGGRPGAGRKG